MSNAPSTSSSSMVDDPEQSSTRRRSLWQDRFSPAPHHATRNRADSNSSSRQHTISPTSTQFTCNICKAVFTRSDLFLRHQQSCANHSMSLLASAEPATASQFAPLSSDVQQNAAETALRLPDSSSPSNLPMSSTDLTTSIFGFDSTGSCVPEEVDWNAFTSNTTTNSPPSSYTYPSPTNPILTTSANPINPDPIKDATVMPTFDFGAPNPAHGDMSAFSDTGLLTTPAHGDLQIEDYKRIFFRTYLPEYPIMHLAKAREYQKSWIVVRAIQACGAVYGGTPEASNFVLDSMRTLRDSIPWEFAQAQGSAEQDNVIVAAALLLTIPIVHKLHLDYADFYRNTLVKMIRQSGLIKRLCAWKSPDNLHTDNNELLNGLWWQWAHYEGMKRILLCVYVQDSQHSMELLLPPSFNPKDLNDLLLTCSPLLFRAETATEWRTLIRLSSEPAGLIGVRLSDALSAIGNGGARAKMPVLNSWSQKAVMQTVHVLLYISRMTAQLLRQPGGITRRPPSSSSSSSTLQDMTSAPSIGTMDTQRSRSSSMAFPNTFFTSASPTPLTATVNLPTPPPDTTGKS